MRLIVPDYYTKFKCIAGRCPDSCCIGWQIDVDEADTVDLSGNQRCPYLNCENLCTKIIEHGEQSLSEICARHPRYFEWFDGFLEGGIGLCCIEAADIILKNKVQRYVELDFDEEPDSHDPDYYDYIDKIRQQIFAVFQDDSLPIAEKLDIISEHQPPADTSAILDFFLSLEIMNPDYRARLLYIKEHQELILPIKNTDEMEQYLSNLGVYFTWRYLIKTIFDDEFDKYRNIIIYSVRMIELLFKSEVLLGTCDFAWWAKEYSKEVEYDEENLARFGEW